MREKRPRRALFLFLGLAMFACLWRVAERAGSSPEAAALSSSSAGVWASSDLPRYAKKKSITCSRTQIPADDLQAIGSNKGRRLADVMSGAVL
eukprot:1113392-Pelagomonas_calceolata.AAC.1